MKKTVAFLSAILLVCSFASCMEMNGNSDSSSEISSTFVESSESEKVSVEGKLFNFNTKWYAANEFRQNADGEYEWYANNIDEVQYTYIDYPGDELDVVTFKLRSAWGGTPIHNRVKFVYNEQVYSYNTADNSWYNENGEKNLNIEMLLDNGKKANLTKLKWDAIHQEFPYVTFSITGINTELQLRVNWPGTNGDDAYASYKLRDIVWTYSSEK